MRDPSFAMATCLLVLVMVVMGQASAADGNRDTVAAGELVLLGEPALTESSGLATSRIRDHRFWSHNDSGDQPRLFAFDESGRKTGQCQLESAGAVDWEDLATFMDDEVARMIVADCGDNLARRKSITLYLLDEPDPDSTTRVKTGQTLTVTYSDGPRDCEAIAVDPLRKQIILIAKTILPAAGIYVIPLPRRGDPVATSTTAKRIGTLTLPMVSAMDMDAKSGDLWIINYFQAFQFRCNDRRGSVDRQLAALPNPLELPRLKQIEAVAVDDSHQVWVTSEGSPAPMTRLSLQPPRSSR